MTAAHPVISARALTKSFGSVRALDGLDLALSPGEVLGFLGPNGAGKSTTIRVLLGLLRPDSGSVQLFRRDPWRDAVELHHRLAHVPGDVELWPHLTGGEVIDLLLRLRGSWSARRRNALIDRFELDPRKRTRTYSKGNRQKVALIAALAADVDLLLLDEPTAGLDPLMEAVFQEVIRERRAEGTSVLLSSHILSQVEALADRVSIIRAGRIVATGSLTDLRHLSRTTIEADLARPATDLAALDGVHHLREEAGRTVLDVDGDRVTTVMAALAPLGIRSLTAHPPTLEQLLLRYYGGAAPETPDAHPPAEAPSAPRTARGRH